MTNLQRSRLIVGLLLIGVAVLSAARQSLKAQFGSGTGSFKTMGYGIFVGRKLADKCWKLRFDQAHIEHGLQ